MSGIDTTQGINSVASTIAALEANGTQVVTTNTGAHVTGLEAAAYEFGAILASYPADAPPLTRNAAVFQVTDANGNTTMVSLNDLADDIRRQTGFDPLIEFSAGIGTTSAGYSVADINYVLGQLEGRYSSMSFAQLVQVQPQVIQELEVSQVLGDRSQGALDELSNIFGDNSFDQIYQALNDGFGAIDLNQNLVVNTQSPVVIEYLNQFDQLPEITHQISLDQQALAEAEANLYRITNEEYLPNDVMAQDYWSLACASPPVGDWFATEFSATATALQTAIANAPSYPNGQVLLDAINAAQAAQDAIPQSFLVAIKLGMSALEDAISPMSFSRVAGLEAQSAFFGGGFSALNNLHGYGTTTSFTGGLISYTNLDPNNPDDVATFNSYMEILIPGSTAGGATPSGLVWNSLRAYVLPPYPLRSPALKTAQAALGNVDSEYSNALSRYNSARSLYANNFDNIIQVSTQQARSSRSQALADARARVAQAQEALAADQQSLSSMMSRLRSTSSPGVASILGEVQSLLGSVSGITELIAADQREISSIQSNIDLANAYLQCLSTGKANQDQIGNTTGVGNTSYSIGAANHFLGTNFSTVADATAALNEYLDAQNDLLTSANQQLDVDVNSLDQIQSEITSQYQLAIEASLPRESLNEVFREVEGLTGVDLEAAFSINGNSISAAEFNRVIAYLNENLPVGADPLPTLSNSQLIQAASQQLKNLLAQPEFERALHSNESGVTLDQPLFSLPGIEMPVSFNDAISKISSNFGVDFSSTLSSLIPGNILNASATVAINSFVDRANLVGGSEFSPARARAIDSATGNVVSLSGALAAQYNFACQLNNIDLTMLLHSGSPISSDATIFVSTDSDGNSTNISLNQLLENYASQGYIFSSILPSESDTFTVADLSAAIDRLNSNQTQDAFMVSNHALIDSGLQQIHNLISSPTALSPESVSSAIGLLTALGVENPKKVYVQALLAERLQSLESPELWKGGMAEKIAINGGKIPVDQPLGAGGKPPSFNDLLEIAAFGSIDLGPICTTKEGRIIAVNGATFNALIEQLNIANNGTPFAIHNNFANSPDIGVVGQLGSAKLSGFSITEAGEDFRSNLSSNFGVIDLNDVPPISVNSAVQDSALVDAYLNDFDVDPRVRSALSYIGQALRQLTDDNFDENHNFSINAQIFTGMTEVTRYLGIADSGSVSLAQIFSYQQSSFGVDIQQALPSLSDANGNISLSNASNLMEVINQAVPDADLPSITSYFGQFTLDDLNEEKIRVNSDLLQIDNLIGAFDQPVNNILLICGSQWAGYNPQLLNFPTQISRIGSIGFQGSSLPVLGLSRNSSPSTTAQNNYYPSAAPVYTTSLAGILGIPSPDSNQIQYDGELASQYSLVVAKLNELVPSFQCPNSWDTWSAQTFASLRSQLQTQRGALEDHLYDITEGFVPSPVEDYLAQNPGMDLVEAKTGLQNIQFVDVSEAVQSGQASAAVTASLNQGVDKEAVPVLSAAEMNAQIEAGDLYVNSRGQFFLNRQPTNARDASVAAMVVSGNKMNVKLNDMMNKVNLNNTKIQIANYLSAATSAADLQTRITEQKAQYGFSDILSEITGGSMSDADIIASTDVSASSTFQSTLKTAINNATRNQDLDTQSLQQLTSQIQANQTAMTQLIQAFEQMLKGLTQNLR